MPNGAFLYADELLGALANKSAANGFKDMVLYIEACESGSIFEARPLQLLVSCGLRGVLLRTGAVPELLVGIQHELHANTQSMGSGVLLQPAWEGL